MRRPDGRLAQKIMQSQHNQSPQAQAERLLAALDMQDFGLRMMRQKLVREHGEIEGQRCFDAWLLAWPPPGVELPQVRDL